MLEPKQFNILEKEEIRKIEKRELDLYRKREEERKVYEIISNVKNRLKPFLQECIFRAFNERNLICDRKNIRSIIRECKKNKKYQRGIKGYNPFDILFSEKDKSLMAKLTFLPTIDFNRGFNFLVLDLTFLLTDLTNFKSIFLFFKSIVI